MRLIRKIEQLLYKLPEQDFILATRLLKERKFDELFLLVQSVLALIDAASLLQKQGTELTEKSKFYIELDRDSIAVLWDYVNDYLSQLDIEELATQNLYDSL